MSALQQIFRGSLLSRERLLQAREFFSPAVESATPEASFARWTERVAVQTELGAARELAGLSEAELKVLEVEFAQHPARLRTDLLRFATPFGGALAVLGGLGLLWQGLAGGGTALSVLAQGFNVACLALGLIALAVGFVSAFSAVPLELSHGTTGLYVSRLDENHPWLYKALSLSANAGADEYRNRILRERGPLRGVDYVLMREIVRGHELLEQTRPARAVAEQLQGQAPTVERRSSQPRLVRVASVADTPALLDPIVTPQAQPGA